MFEAGSQVFRNSNDQVGTTFGTRKNSAGELMIEVQWPSGVRQWMPESHVTALDKPKAQPKESSLPPYLRDIPRNKSRYNSHREQELAARQLADTLVSLGSNRKHGSKTRMHNKAQNLISKFNKGIYPANMRRKERTPQQQAAYERGIVKHRKWKRDHPPPAPFTKEEKARYAATKREQAEMKKLYQEKLGDYNY